jgi:hypothetical protein
MKTTESSRNPTVQELEAMDNFIANPQLLSVSETKEYLKSLGNSPLASSTIYI